MLNAFASLNARKSASMHNVQRPFYANYYHLVTRSSWLMSYGVTHFGSAIRECTTILRPEAFHIIKPEKYTQGSI